MLVQAVTQLMQYQFNDFLNLFCLQRFEHNDVINTVHENERTTAYCDYFRWKRTLGKIKRNAEKLRTRTGSQER